MIAETKHCLRNLTNFNGRDSRSTFWWYVLALVILQFLLGLVAAIPMAVGVMGEAMTMAQNGAPPDDLNGALFGMMGPMLKNQLLIGMGISVLMAALFSAAFVRRLHDSNKPGWIVLLPLGTLAFSQIYGFMNIDAMMQSMQLAAESGSIDQIGDMQRQIQGYSAVGYLGYLIVILFGVFDSTPGPNRYGEGPAEV